MSEKIKIEIDGRPLEVEKGSMLLEGIRSLGIQVPTLCHHPALEPNGECRLCMVEITHPDWNGWSNLVTSCLYPASPGLIVMTRSERVREARRTLFELYLAQYPKAGLLRDLARSEGVDTTPFPESSRLDKCVLCGLCIRTCQELSVACGACAFVCPTGEIQMTQADGKFHIWNREFDIPLCEVEKDLCRGCGICEEVCPWDIPRMVPLKTGEVTAYITPSYCTGCGICAGACPTGAIKQDAFSDGTMSGADLNNGELKGQTVVFACSRSPFPAGTEHVIEVPCIGRVGVEHMLDCLARGAEGVLLMCRDQATCPSGPGGRLGEERAVVVDELSASIGLGRGRVRYLKPDPGLGAPAAALAQFKTGLSPTPLKFPLDPATESIPGLDRALRVITQLRHRPELTSVLPDNLKNIFKPIDNEIDTLLYLGDLPDLDLLLSLSMKEWRLDKIFMDAAEILRQRDIRVQPVFTVQEINASSASRVVTFCPSSIPGLKRDIERITIGSLSGIKPSRSGPADCSFKFRIGQPKRRELLSRLQDSGRSLACSCPHELAQYKLLARQGAWLGAISNEPVMAFSEVVRPTHGY